MPWTTTAIADTTTVPDDPGDPESNPPLPRRSQASPCRAVVQVAGGYINVGGNCIPSPRRAPGTPTGATAICRDGTCSFSQKSFRHGTCSHRGGVAQYEVVDPAPSDSPHNEGSRERNQGPARLCETESSAQEDRGVQQTAPPVLEVGRAKRAQRRQRGNRSHRPITCPVPSLDVASKPQLESGSI
jgi:hypothetical protein